MNKKENYKAKIICGIIMIVAIGGVFYLTFQPPEQTTKLSETVRLWLKNMGWEMTPKQIRRNVHIPIYFLLGIAVFTFGHLMKWKWYVTLLFAVGVALFDEGIKVFLPTREFDYEDLFKDFLGLGIAWILLVVLKR